MSKITGPYVFRKWAHTPEEMADIERLGLTPVRLMMNDGSVPIAGTDKDGDLVTIAVVYPTTKPKRGEGHKHEDPDRDDLAQAIVDALNKK